MDDLFLEAEFNGLPDEWRSAFLRVIESQVRSLVRAHNAETFGGQSVDLANDTRICAKIVAVVEAGQELRSDLERLQVAERSVPGKP